MVCFNGVADYDVVGSRRFSGQILFMKFCHTIKIARNNREPLDIFCRADRFCTYTGAPCLSPSCPLMEHQARFGFPSSATYDKVVFFPLCVKHEAGKLRSTAALLFPAPSLCLQDSVFLKLPLSRGCVVELVQGLVACVCLQPVFLSQPLRTLVCEAVFSRLCILRVLLMCVRATRALPCGLRMSADREVGRNSV